jgi:hypothetical protein
MRKLLAATCAITASLLISSTAMADTVTRTPSPKISPFTFVGLCQFDVLAQAVVNREYTISFVNNDGLLVKQIVTGASVVTFTNLSNNASITLNISGPGKITYNPDGSATLDILGREFGFPGDTTGAGRTVIEISPSGVPTLVSQVGNYTSLCSLLAG